MIKKIAFWILRKDVEALILKNKELDERVAYQASKVKQLEAAVNPQLYADLHNSDRESFWKELKNGIDEDAARAWAFERLNRRLQSIVGITPEAGSDFYVAQGAIAELNNFLQIHKLMAAYLREDLPPPKDKEEDEEQSMSDQHA